MYCLLGFFVYSWEFQNSYIKTVKGPIGSFYLYAFPVFKCTLTFRYESHTHTGILLPKTSMLR